MHKLIKFLITGLLIIISYCGLYTYLRISDALYVRYIMAKAAIQYDANKYIIKEEYIMFAYKLAVMFEEEIRTMNNPGSKDLGTHYIVKLEHCGQKVGIHNGGISFESDDYIIHNFWGTPLGYWNVDENVVTKALNKLNKVKLYSDILYDTIRPPWHDRFVYFKDIYDKGMYGIQAIGVYNGNHKRIFLNFGYDSWEANWIVDQWSYCQNFRKVYDGGANFVRMEYDVDADEIYNFDVNWSK